MSPTRSPWKTGRRNSTQRVVLVSGLLLTWYGPSLATARADLLGVIG